MANATFYIIKADSPQANESGFLGYVVFLAQHFAKQGAKVLAENETTFANKFAEVVDFVPCEEKAKQLARERYKIYRQAGYQLQTIEIEHN